MRSDNSAFATQNTAASARPFFVVEVAFDFANTDLEYFTSHSAALTPAGASVTYSVVESIGGTSQEINPLKARSSIGKLEFSLVDVDGAVTDIIRAKLNSDQGLRNKRERVYMGFEGMDSWDDYILIQTQIIRSVSWADGGYDFECRDIQRQTRKELFVLKQTALSASLTADATTVDVYQTDDFEMVDHGTSYSDAASQKVGYIKIGDGDKSEIIRYTGKTATSFTGCTRGVLGTQPRAWAFEGGSEDNGVQVQEYVYLEMPALKVAYALLTGDLYNQAGESLPAHWHLGIDTQYIATADFTSIIDWWDPTDDTAGVITRFTGLEEEDGKQFIEEQIMRLLGAFMPVYSDGQLGCKRLAPVLTDSSFVETLDESSVVDYSDLEHDFTELANRFLIVWNWNDQRGDYTRYNVLQDTNSQTIYGDAELMRMEFRGLHGSRHSADTINNRFRALQDRYSGPPIKLTIDALPRMNKLEVGDVVRVTLPQIQDYTGADTLHRSFEVQERQINWQNGEVSLTLFSSSLRAAPAPITTGDTAIADSWYTSVGTDLATLTGASESGGVLTLTQDVTLDGTTDITAAGSIWYTIYDLVIPDGVTITITGNVQLRIRGFLTLNGTIDGIGGGRAGLTAAQIDTLAESESFPSYTYGAGTPGFIGTTKGSGGAIAIAIAPSIDYDDPGPNNDVGIARGQYNSFPQLSLEFANGSLTGMPGDLRGTSGGGGGRFYNSQAGGPGSAGSGLSSVILDGGTGGGSGAGLALICRGMAFGSSGLIDLSGDDGQLGDLGSHSSWVNQYYAGSGAGGAPGALLVVIDDALQAAPDIASNFVAQMGDTPLAGTSMAAFIGSPPYRSWFVGTYEIGEDIWQSAHRIAYIRTSEEPAEDPPEVSPQPTTIILDERRNTPESPAGNLSTIDVAVTPPSPLSGYSHANIYWRVDGDEGWTLAGAADNERSVGPVASDGVTYQFQARSVSEQGVESATGPTATITVYDVEEDNSEPPDEDPRLVVPPPLRPQLLGGSDGIYTGRSATLIWDPPSNLSWYELGQEPTAQGAGAGGVDQYFSHYDVEIVVSGSAVNTYRATDERFTYAYEDNVADNGTAVREYTVRIWTVGRQGQRSERCAYISISNPAPSLTSIQITPQFNTATAAITRPTDLDFARFKVWVGTSSGFTRDASTLVYEGPDNEINVAGLSAGTTYYLRYQPVDDFGPGPESGEVALTTQTAADVSWLGQWAEIDIGTRTQIEEWLQGTQDHTTTFAPIIAAGQIVSGVIQATELIESEGLIRVVDDINTPSWLLTMGPESVGGTVRLLSFRDSADQIIHAINADGTFVLGSGSNNQIQWDGSTLDIRGDLHADDITAGGTITGNTLQTAASGTRFVVSATDGQGHYYGDADGAGTIAELITLGISTVGVDATIIDVGGGSQSMRAINAEANIGSGVAAVRITNSHASGTGLKVFGGTLGIYVTADTNAVYARRGLNGGAALVGEHYDNSLLLGVKHYFDGINGNSQDNPNFAYLSGNLPSEYIAGLWTGVDGSMWLWNGVDEVFGRLRTQTYNDDNYAPIASGANILGVIMLLHRSVSSPGTAPSISAGGTVDVDSDSAVWSYAGINTNSGDISINNSGVPSGTWRNLGATTPSDGQEWTGLFMKISS